MRILMIQPNYHAGGAEIAGSWPPGRVAYIGGTLKTAGYPNIRLVDAMRADINYEGDQTTRRAPTPFNGTGD